VTLEYYLGYFKNWEDGEPSVILMNTASQPISFKIEAPGVGFSHMGIVRGNSDTTVSIPSDLVVTVNDSQSKGICIQANGDGLAVIGQTEQSNTSETFLALPLTRSNTNEEFVYFGISAPVGRIGYQGALLVVGTKDNTTMKLTVTQKATANSNISLLAGIEYLFVINRFQTFYIRSLQDISGTKIATNNEVSVFSGHECTQVPFNISGCDVLVEQVPPTIFWGTDFYISPFATKRSYIFKIIGSHNSTVIDIYCNNIKESRTINEGEHYNKTVSQHCAIHSNKGIMVIQFNLGHNVERTNGDPLIIVLPNTFQYSSNFFTSTIRNPHSSYAHYISIIVLAQYYQPDQIHLIARGRNVSLDTQTWVPIRVNNIIEAYSTDINIREGGAKIIHTNREALMTITVYGFAVLESYGHAGKIISQRGIYMKTLYCICMCIRLCVSVYIMCIHLCVSVYMSSKLAYIYIL